MAGVQLGLETEKHAIVRAVAVAVEASAAPAQTSGQSFKLSIRFTSRALPPTRALGARQEGAPGTK